MKEREDRLKVGKKKSKQASKHARTRQMQRLLSDKTVHRISIKIFIVYIYSEADQLRDRQRGILPFLLMIEANYSFLC